MEKYKVILAAEWEEANKTRSHYTKAWVVQVDGRREHIKAVTAAFTGEDAPLPIVNLHDPRIIRRIKPIGRVLIGTQKPRDPAYPGAYPGPRLFEWTNMVPDLLAKENLARLVDEAADYVEKLQKKKARKCTSPTRGR